MPKAIRVIESCKTSIQIKVAKRYCHLALKASLSPAYIQLVQAAENYFILDKELKHLIQKRENDIIDGKL
jgi:hypothetical protein